MIKQYGMSLKRSDNDHADWVPGLLKVPWISGCCSSIQFADIKGKKRFKFHFSGLKNID